MNSPLSNRKHLLEYSGPAALLEGKYPIKDLCLSIAYYFYVKYHQDKGSYLNLPLKVEFGELKFPAANLFEADFSDRATNLVISWHVSSHRICCWLIRHAVSNSCPLWSYGTFWQLWNQNCACTWNTFKRILGVKFWKDLPTVTSDPSIARYDDYSPLKCIYAAQNKNNNSVYFLFVTAEFHFQNARLTSIHMSNPHNPFFILN